MTAGPDDRRDLVAAATPVKPGLPARLGLYFHTVRHLQMSQIAWQLKRRLWPPRPPVTGPAVHWRAGVRCAPFLPAPEALAAVGQIAFVGQTRPFALEHPDWVQSDAPKLWRYNLHYFDYLGWPTLADAGKAALINDWSARVRLGAEDAWEPYPISLRVVNWLKYALALPPGTVPAEWVASLAHQGAALEGDLEYHLLANHLLKNGKALVFAGVCLKGPAAERWLAKGLEIMVAAAAEQILPDGGHLERSPMYHCIVLEDFLDVVNLLAANPERVTSEVLVTLRDAAIRATGFLRAICTGADDIPLFNDAAFGITQPVRELLAYADRVLVGAASGAIGNLIAAEAAPTAATPIPVAAEAAPTGARIFFPHTGYYGYRHGGDSLIIDCGPVGPDYQPGHTHCDTLSYELHVGGVPIVVDSGTFDYEPGAFRHYLRSTAAHNTVRIDGQEQSEIWGAFRVARRARPRAVTLGEWDAGRLRFAGEHDGYERLPGRPVHRREVVMETGRWTVRDSVTGAGRHRVESFLHLHPAVGCKQLTDREFRLTAPGGVVLRLKFGPEGKLTLASGYYCPRFGERLACGALVLEHTAALPVEFTYGFERL